MLTCPYKFVKHRLIEVYIIIIDNRSG